MMAADGHDPSLAVDGADYEQQLKAWIKLNSVTEPCFDF